MRLNADGETALARGRGHRHRHPAGGAGRLFERFFRSSTADSTTRSREPASASRSPRRSSNAHGGHIEIESRENAGTVVRVEPAARARAPREGRPRARPPTATRAGSGSRSRASSRSATRSRPPRRACGAGSRRTASPGRAPRRLESPHARSSSWSCERTWFGLRTKAVSSRNSSGVSETASAARGHGALREVDRDEAVRVALGLRFAAAPAPEGGVDAGQQLLAPERLGHVVVRAGAQAAHLVELLGPRGQHQDRNVAQLADPLERRPSRRARASRRRGSRDPAARRRRPAGPRCRPGPRARRDPLRSRSSRTSPRMSASSSTTSTQLTFRPSAQGSSGRSYAFHTELLPNSDVGRRCACRGELEAPAASCVRIVDAQRFRRASVFPARARVVSGVGRPLLQGWRLAGPYAGAGRQRAVLQRRPPERAISGARQSRRSRQPRVGRRERKRLFGRWLLRSSSSSSSSSTGGGSSTPSHGSGGGRQRHPRNLRLPAARADRAGGRSGGRRPRRTSGPGRSGRPAGGDRSGRRDRCGRRAGTDRPDRAAGHPGNGGRARRNGRDRPDGPAGADRSAGPDRRQGRDRRTRCRR